MTQGSAKHPSGRYGLIALVAYTADDTFTKASYPGASSFVVHVVGAGGGGGYCTGSGAGAAEAAGGGGGGYSQSRLVPSDLAASETVTVGVGGAGGIGSTATSATNGEDSSFGTHVVGVGGSAGAGDSRAAAVVRRASGSGGSVGGATGDIKVGGGDGGFGVITDASGAGTWYPSWNNWGGAAAGPFGGGLARTSNSVNTAGSAGSQYGCGGSGARSSNATDYDGGAGADGVVVIEVWGSV